MAVGHSGFYCPKKPVKPIKSRSKQLKAVKTVSKPKKKETRSQVVKKLDAVYSQYIRLLKSDDDGYCICVTCGTKLYWKEIQNGHYFSRKHYATRWNDDNCWPQDYRCNVALNGNYIEYTMFMINTYGINFIGEFKKQANTTYKISLQELRDKIDHYSTEVNRLKSTKGIAN